MDLWTTIIVPAFAMLFVVIDPISCVPMYMALTSDADPRSRRKVAVKAVVVASGILALFAVAGESVLSYLGISLPAFRIAGGLLLFLIAVEMLFEKRTERRQRSVDVVTAEQSQVDGPQDSTAGFVDNVSIFPLGIPLVAGPGAIAGIILLRCCSTTGILE